MPEVPARWYDMQNSHVVIPEHVVFRALAQETVALNIRTGQYHGIDAIGARFFEVLRTSTHVSAACDELAAEFDQPLAVIRTDVAAFVDDLVERGLVMLDASHRPA